MKVEMAVQSSPVLNKPCDFYGHKHHERRSRLQTELRSCVKVEVAVLVSPSLLVLMVSMDVKQHFEKEKRKKMSS